MLIWRGLQPKVMAQLMVGLAQARQDARSGTTKTAQPAPAKEPVKKG
ncbi:hypothetical protein ACM64Y_06005 [Novispirillum sp. DQ9]